MKLFNVIKQIRYLPIGLLALFCLSFTTQQVAFAADDTASSTPCNANRDFDSGNDIEFYDRCAIPCAVGTGADQLTGIDNTEKVLKFLMDKGLNLAQSAGIVGNLVVESGLTPNIQEHSQSFPSGGWGLAQWTGGRRTTMLAAINKAGLKRLYVDGTPKLSATDNDALLSAELTFLWSEAQGPESEALRALKTVSNDPVQAANVWEMKFERPLNFDTRRGVAAKKVYDKYSDAPPLSDGSGGSSAAPVSAPSPNCGDTTTDASLTTFQQTVKKYAWPKYWQYAKRNPKTPMPAYKTRIDSIKNKGIYTGGRGDPYVDCGGFVTNLMLGSGYEPGYNHSGKFSDGAGTTAIQEAWAQKHWKSLGTGKTLNNGDLRPGDVAFVTGHTWVFVGKITGFNSQYASAAIHQWAPTASFETKPSDNAMISNHDTPRWYRKGGTSV